MILVPAYFLNACVGLGNDITNEDKFFKFEMVLTNERHFLIARIKWLSTLGITLLECLLATLSRQLPLSQPILFDPHILSIRELSLKKLIVEIVVSGW